LKDVGGGGFDFSPSMRRHLGQAAGESMMRSMTTDARRPFVHRSQGDPNMPGMFGQPQDFFVDPEVGDRDRARLDALYGANIADQVSAQFTEPTMYRKAGVTEDLEDFGQQRELDRYYDPREWSRRDASREFDLRKATEPARLAADSRVDVADLNRDGRVSAAEAAAAARRYAADAAQPSAAETIAENFDNLSRSRAVRPQAE
jgi:hypothetical protein